jgi:hypothetical protein
LARPLWSALSPHMEWRASSSPLDSAGSPELLTPCSLAPALVAKSGV